MVPLLDARWNQQGISETVSLSSLMLFVFDGIRLPRHTAPRITHTPAHMALLKPQRLRGFVCKT